MKQSSIAAALALAVLSLGPAASAQVPSSSMTVDAVGVSSTGDLAVTGVVQGQQAPSTRVISFTYGTEAAKSAAREHCVKLLLLALSKPGQYVVAAGQDVCRVSLVAP